LARFAPPLLWLALIVYWSGQSDLPIDHPPIAQWLGGAQHRMAHVAAFAVLAALVRLAIDGTPRATLGAFLFVVGFAATDEWHQSFTPGRHPALDDVLVDSGSALVSVLVVDAVLRGRHEQLAVLRSPVLARAFFAMLLVVAVAPAVAPPMVLAGRPEGVAGITAGSLKGQVVRLEGAGRQLVARTRAGAAATVAQVRRHVERA
jgi:VanZ family protein